MNVCSYGRRLAMGIAVAAGVLVMAGQTALATSALPSINGKQLGLWTALWWQWAYAQRLNEGPSFQAGPIDCSYGQKGKDLVSRRNRR